jgi:hypothetical protein
MLLSWCLRVDFEVSTGVTLIEVASNANRPQLSLVGTGWHQRQSGDDEEIARTIDNGANANFPGSDQATRERLVGREACVKQ